jgi:hypothetical protein
MKRITLSIAEKEYELWREKAWRQRMNFSKWIRIQVRYAIDERPISSLKNASAKLQEKRAVAFNRDTELIRSERSFKEREG